MDLTLKGRGEATKDLLPSSPRDLLRDLEAYRSVWCIDDGVIDNAVANVMATKPTNNHFV